MATMQHLDVLHCATKEVDSSLVATMHLGLTHHRACERKVHLQDLTMTLGLSSTQKCTLHRFDVVSCMYI